MLSDDIWNNTFMIFVFFLCLLSDYDFLIGIEYLCHIMRDFWTLISIFIPLFLARFIHNYTESALERHLRSESPRPSCDAASCSADVCVQEVTSKTFHSVVMQPGKVTLETDAGLDNMCEK